MSDYVPSNPVVISNWHHMMKRSMVKANQAIDAWEKRSAEVNETCDRLGLEKNLRRFHRRDDIQLKEHFATYEFFAAEVHRFGAMIQAELSMRKLMEKDE